MELSIVMPCLNEAETLAICIQKARHCLDENSIDGEIVVADNGSIDGSQKIAKTNGARVIHVQRKGYGSALRGGIEASSGTYIIMADADDSYDFSSLFPFIEKLRDGYDLVMGNRFKGGVAKGAMPFLHKYLGNPVLTFIGKLFFKCPANDFHCGLRGFSKDAYHQMRLVTTGMEFASEMVIKATLSNLKIIEIPTTLSPDGRTGKPHLNTWRDGWRHLRFMLLYSPKWMFFYPGVIMMVIGFVLSAILLMTNVTIKGVTFDINTLLFTTVAFILGYQSVLFYLFSNSYAKKHNLVIANQSSGNNKKKFSLENGLILGVFLFMIGFCLAVYAFYVWGIQRNFGSFNPMQGMRIVIPSAGLMILGFQTFMGSFFRSVLDINSIAYGKDN